MALDSPNGNSNLKAERKFSPFINSLYRKRKESWSVLKRTDGLFLHGHTVETINYLSVLFKKKLEEVIEKMAN